MNIVHRLCESEVILDCFLGLRSMKKTGLTRTTLPKCYLYQVRYRHLWNTTGVLLVDICDYELNFGSVAFISDLDSVKAVKETSHESFHSFTCTIFISMTVSKIDKM
jgi:Ni,Fe-hydrogenase maturation factor